MPFPVPSRDDLTAQILADQQARIPGADAGLRVSMLGILAKIWSGPLALMWGFLGRYWAKQFFTDSAETIYLERRAAPYRIVREAAVAAAGPDGYFAGTNGIVVPAGTIVQTSDGTVQYTSQAAVTITAGIGTVGIAATAGGDAGNQSAGTALPLYTGIAGIPPAFPVGASGPTGRPPARADAPPP